MLTFCEPKLIAVSHNDRAPALHLTAAALRAEILSPANTPLAMPASPFVSQLNCASFWGTGKMNLTVSVESVILSNQVVGLSCI